MAELKTQVNESDVVEFLNEIEDEESRNDCISLLYMFEELTGEKPMMWGESIIGFGRYHYKYASGREGDWFLTGFSPRKQNLTIYITSGFEPFEDILKHLGRYKTGASCLYVKRLSDINSEKLELLVKKSVAYMKQLYELKV